MDGVIYVQVLCANVIGRLKENSLLAWEKQKDDRGSGNSKFKIYLYFKIL